MNWLRRLFGLPSSAPTPPPNPKKSKYVLYHSQVNNVWLVEYDGKYLSWDMVSGTYQTTVYDFYAYKFRSEESAMHAVKQHRHFVDKTLWVRKEVE